MNTEHWFILLLTLILLQYKHSNIVRDLLNYWWFVVRKVVFKCFFRSAVYYWFEVSGLIVFRGL